MRKYVALGDKRFSVKLCYDIFHSVFNLMGSETREVAFNGNFVVARTDYGVIQYYPLKGKISTFLSIDEWKNKAIMHLAVSDRLIVISEKYEMLVYEANGQEGRKALGSFNFANGVDKIKLSQSDEIIVLSRNSLHIICL